VGLVLVAQGLQSLTPIAPTLAGGVVVLNAAISDGPLGAFRTVPRRTHRIVDLVVIAALIVLAALPWLDIDSTSRLTLAAIAVVLGFVWWNSSFEEPVVRPPSAPIARSELAGKVAGRAVAGAVRAVRLRRGR